MSTRSSRRQLLKFSHYSVAVVLPKKALDQLGWQPGDTVAITPNTRDQSLRIHRDKSVPHEKITPASMPGPTLMRAHKSAEASDDDEILPIPELET